MHDTDKPTGKKRDQGNAFQINDGPPATTEPSGDADESKPQGDAFQINGDPDDATRRKPRDKQ